ncbi:MAG: hypothetical protein ACYC7A_19370 [Thermoanaerobaculia bacterium]
MDERPQLPTMCVVCKTGDYVPIPADLAADLHNSGLGLRLVSGVRWRALEYDGCGNVQVFRRRAEVK